MQAARKITVELGERSYDVVIGKNLIESANDYIDFSRRIAIITDSGVPDKYIRTVKALANDVTVITFEQGEENKNINTYESICEQLLSFGLKRKDAIIAIGGGVVGDVAGFVASTYMRGIDFYNIPTTLLAQVDSSVGGKCALNLGGVKNILGSFYQPRSVIIDVDTLSTLDKRQVSSGIAEIVKMALTCDQKFFEDLEADIYKTDIEGTIERALLIKKSIVESDECENGLRKVLNFGHTLGHGIERASGLYHGESVALGMIPMCSPMLRERLKQLLNRIELSTELNFDLDKALAFMKHDKKGDGDNVDAIFVDSPGKYRIEKMPLATLCEYIKNTVEA